MYRQSEKNLLNSNTPSTSPDNVVNFGQLTAEICWRVWGTPANFNGFRVFACSVTARHSGSGRQPNFAALNRGRHLYSAGRPSRWTNILVFIIFQIFHPFSQKPSWTDMHHICAYVYDRRPNHLWHVLAIGEGLSAVDSVGGENLPFPHRQARSPLTQLAVPALPRSP